VAIVVFEVTNLKFSGNTILEVD